MPLAARLLTLRRSPLLLKLPPYLSALCIVVGIAWLLLLPLDDYSRETYISENAILPGQVHPYFGGSEHNIFRAFRHEVWQLSHRSDHDRIADLERVLHEIGLKTATQSYSYKVAGEEIKGNNVYGIIQGPRADATEAMVLIAAWRNFENEINYSGVALAITLARYFKRWSIWSKDIILLIPDDSTYGPEAWVSAYHSTSTEITSTRNISSLPLKGGALQGAVALDYPAGPWGQRFDKLDVLYDGINGALPNLDLLNTAVQIASSQMGITCTLHNMADPGDSYRDRLTAISKGLITQSIGHATGPHSAFMPYHVDAITLRTIGDGWHDEMSLGKTTESLFRSINNILEHLHQSFFFYMLLSSQRFVSIGNYLPAAMIVAANFSITALALWVKSGKAAPSDIKNKSIVDQKMEVVKDGDAVALIPKSETQTVERNMFVPAAMVLAVHLAGLLPLYLLTHVSRAYLHYTFALVAIASHAFLLLITTFTARLPPQQVQILQSFSLLFLAAVLSMLATLNFSLAFIIGLLCAPLSFIRPFPHLPPRATIVTAADAMDYVGALAECTLPNLIYLIFSPVVAPFLISAFFRKGVEWTLLEMARGWVAQGVWTSLVVWGVWWPAWVVGGSVMFSGILRKM